MTPEQRVLRARIANSVRWAHEPDRTAATSPARDAFMARFEKQVDPDGVLDPVERSRRAECAKTAHFQRMALASSRSRGSRKAQCGNQPAA